jgi:hypothetical protein
MPCREDKRQKEKDKSGRMTKIKIRQKTKVKR